MGSAPGQQALEAIEHRTRGGDRHWSGLPRKQMTDEIRKLRDGRGLGAILEPFPKDPLSDKRLRMSVPVSGASSSR